ncbi:MAG TPA: hypothetical protein VMZ31_12725 [Phycisphaerae bacterium]|nr:hypothetical protein [Phycisphaerae bacterium]
MGLLDWYKNRPRPLTQLSRRDLRRKELLLQKQRDQLLRRIEKLADDKQTLFEKGAGEKTPEVRRALAQEFELKTAEQLMLGRQLNIRSKETLTVSRLRMLKENAEQSRTTGDRLGMISQADMLRLERMIESDAVTSELYQERLDDLLSTAATEQGAAGLSEAGQAVMRIWDQVDSGMMKSTSEAFDEADRRVREQQAEPGEG